MTYSRKQQGFSLFMVMIIMLVIALLVVVTTQSATTEMRISTNEADRKYAMSLAENGLREAESTIQQFMNLGSSKKTFSYDCQGGFCAPVEPVFYVNKTSSHYQISDNGKSTYGNIAAYKRTPNNDGKSVLEISSTRLQSGKDQGVYYIIEFLGERDSSSGIINTFRVTVRAHGQNENSVVTLQSYVEMIE